MGIKSLYSALGTPLVSVRSVAENWRTTPHDGNECERTLTVDAGCAIRYSIAGQPISDDRRGRQALAGTGRRERERRVWQIEVLAGASWVLQPPRPPFVCCKCSAQLHSTVCLLGWVRCY